MSDLVLSVRLTADGKDLVGAVKVSADELDKLGGATKRTASEAEKLNSQQKSLGESLNGLASRIGAYTIGWNVATEAVMKAAGAIRDYIRDAALLNARHETMGVVMEVVGRNAGYSRREMDLYAASVRNAGITMIAARENVTKMVQANLDLSIASKLARAAQDAAVIANINSSEAFTRLIYGIQSGQPEMLRTMGINVNFEASYKKLAAQLHVTTEQLTEQEKMQARANAVMEATTRIAGTYEAAMGTAGKMMNSLARYTEDLKVMRGEVFNDALVIAVNAYTDALKDANTETRRLADNKKLQEWGRDLVTTFAWIGDIIVGAFDGISSVVELTVTSTLRALNGLRNGLLMAYPGGRLMAGLLGGLTGTDIDAYINSYGAKVGENVDARLNRKQFRASVEEYYKARDADAAERELQQREGDREMALARSLGLRVGPAAEARPTGKGAGAGAGGDPYPALLKHLQQKLELDKESTEVERLQIDLNALSAKQLAKMNEEDIVHLFGVAQLVDAKKQAMEVDKAALEFAKVQIAQQEKSDETLAAFNTTMSEHLQQIQFETDSYGKSQLEKETAIELRKLDAEFARAQIGLDEERLKTLTELYDLQRQQLPSALAARDATRAIEESAKAGREEFKRTNDEIGRGLTDALMRGFDKGKGFAESFRDGVVNMFKTMVLTPVIKYVLSPVSGAIASGVTGMGLSGAASAAGAAAAAGNAAGPSIGTALSNFGTAAATFSTMMAEGSTAAASFSAAAAGMGPSLMAVVPYVGVALAAAYALGLFDSNDQPPPGSRYDNWARLQKNPAGQFGIGSSEVPDPQAMTQLAQAINAALNDPAKYDPALLNQLVGKTVSGPPGTTSQALIDALTQQLSPAAEAAAKTVTDLANATAIAAQRHQLEIELMKAQGNAAGALAAERKDELAALDPSLRALKEEIYAQQDLRNAATGAADAVKTLAERISDTQSAALDSVNKQIDASRSASQAARQAADSFRQIGTTLANAVIQLRGGDLSPLLPAQKLAESGANLNTVFGKAMTGDAAALSALPQAATDFLDASRAYNASSQAYTTDFARVMDMLAQAQTASTAMVNWNDYHATLLETQTSVLGTIKTELEKPSPDTAILLEQAGLLDAIHQALLAQTVQVIAGNTFVQDQTGRIIAVNDTQRDQTGQIVAGNALINAQTGQINTGNVLTNTQTSQIITGNTIQDAVRNITALDSHYSEEMLRALVTGATTQTDSLQGLVGGSDVTVSLLRQLVDLTGQKMVQDQAAAAAAVAASAAAEAQAAADRAVQEQMTQATAAFQAQKVVTDALSANWLAAEQAIGATVSVNTAENVAANQRMVINWSGPADMIAAAAPQMDAYFAAFAREYDLYKAIPGHASGLPYVPHDNYLMRAHEGEAVVDAGTMAALRSYGIQVGGGVGGAGAGAGKDDIESLKKALTEALDKINVILQRQAEASSKDIKEQTQAISTAVADSAQTIGRTVARSAEASTRA